MFKLQQGNKQIAHYTPIMDVNSNVVLRSFRHGLAERDEHYHHNEPTLATGTSTETHTPATEGGEDVDRQLNSVQIIDVHHTYAGDNELVLRGVNMRVPTSSIYGLLGASGCGKTTLLKSIIGLVKPTSGYVDVFGFEPGSRGSGIPGPMIGYMPQDVALYTDLTIEEILYYFGRLYFMERKDIRIQTDYLLVLLDLPDKGRLISTLSGGQMRRVSFSAALIHAPPLVILDEPTAGVDPLLRSNIWKHLRNICLHSATTVIITTHYIEEAAGADRVGLMRKGQMLEEDAPQALLAKYGKQTLEDVFLELCTARKLTKIKQPIDESDALAAIGIGRPSTTSQIVARKKLQRQLQDCVHRRSKRKELRSTIQTWYLMFMTLLWKCYVRSIRHPQLIVFQYLLPLVQIILFCICIGADPFDIKIGIVNDESPPYLSTLFLKNLDPYFIQQKNFSTLEEAKEETRRARLWGVIHLRSNFSDALIARLDIKSDPSNETIEQSRIMIYPDLTDKLIHITIQRSLEDSYQLFLKDCLIEFELEPGLASLPIKIGYPIYGQVKHKSHRSYRDFMASGILLAVTFSMAYALTTLVLVLEREEKTFERNFVTGVTASQIIISHTLNRLAFMVLQVILLLSVTTYVFNIPSRGPILCALILLLAQNLAGVAYGMLISAAASNLIGATAVAIGTLFFIIFVSGTIWPVQAIPSWLQWFSLTQPNTIPIMSFRSILLRGWGWTHPGVVSGFGVTFLWIFVLFAVSIATFRYD